MTMLNHDDTAAPAMTESEREHLALMDVSTSAKTIARSALRVAYSDVAAAFNQLEAGTTDEALQIIAEAREQLEFAATFLRGRIWELRV